MTSKISAKRPLNWTMGFAPLVLLIVLQLLTPSHANGQVSRTRQQLSSGHRQQPSLRGVGRALEEEPIDEDEETEVWDETDEEELLAEEMEEQEEEANNNLDGEGDVPELFDTPPPEVEKEEEETVVVDTEDQVDTPQDEEGEDTEDEEPEVQQESKQQEEVAEEPEGGEDTDPVEEAAENEELPPAHEGEEVNDPPETKAVEEEPPTPPPVPAPTPPPVPAPTNPPISPTEAPTKPYKPIQDDPVKEEDELFEQEEEVQELEQELNQEEKVARRAGGLGIFIGIVAMVFTAHQMSENPDGIYASVCRLAITISSVVVKIICMPCRKLLGAGNPHYQGHMPISTSDYGYRNDPYRSSANAGFEMS